MTDSQLNHDWKMVKFSDIAQNVSVRVDPADAKTDVYVGLEHLDPSTIHLRQWGKPSDVTGQKLAFKKGDVIFGRRRAYQRKLAVAEFDGICSAHAMVARAKPKMILPEFLPFFLQSDMFMERAIEISVGSLSPTINWKTLREQVFPLPPIDEQKRIAEMLCTADEAVEKWTVAYRQAESALSSTRSQILQELSQTEECISLKDIGRWVSGGTPSRSRSDFWNGDFPWVSPKDMKQDVISDSEEKLTDTALNGRITILPSESILIVVRGMILAHTFPVALTGREVTFNQDMKGIIPNSDFSAEFVFHWFKDNSARILQATEESTHGTKRLATDVLYGMQIPKPSPAKQEMAVTVFETFRTKLAEISEHIASSQQMLRSLRNAKVGAAHV
ncbi:MAG: restriction endonuclease subunit S [Spirochaetia bacterium]|nr:restriction endonuclease subunit S [Spirochaetia bacterium]